MIPTTIPAGAWPEALIFDLDGTLVDTAPDLAAALDHVLDSYGRPPLGLEPVRHMVGDGARALLERGFAATGGVPPEGIDPGFDRFLAYYRAHIADFSRPFPDVLEQIAAARDAGTRIAICTNKPQAPTEQLLTALDMADLLDAVVCGDSLPTRKPDPAMVTECLRRLKVGAAGTVMLGDSINDVLAARGAGVPVVVVTFGYTMVPAAELGGDALLDSFAALPSALKGIVPAPPRPAAGD